MTDQQLNELAKQLLRQINALPSIPDEHGDPCVAKNVVLKMVEGLFGQRKVLCSECFDLVCPGSNFYMYPQSKCDRCGRECLGYVESRKR